MDVVDPGAIDALIWTRSGMSPERLAAVTGSIASGIPLARVGYAREVASTVAFLVSGDASYITGRTSASV